MKFNTLRNIFLILVLALVSTSCGQQTKIEKELNDLKKAIETIDSRRESENKIIKEEHRAIEILKSNLEKANSDGMRDKLSREISLKQSVIEKAEKNSFNQGVILKELRLKKDSIEGLRDKQ